MSEPRDELQLWTIYERPRDYPDGYVVRRSRILRGGVVLADTVAQYAASLASAQALVPKWAHRMPRCDDDDACIVEVWV